MNKLVILALFIAVTTSCKKEVTKRFVAVGASCHHCSVHIAAGGVVKDFELNHFFQETFMLEPGGDVSVTAVSLVDSSNQATCVWVKVDDVPSGFEFARPDTTVSLNVTVP